MKKLLLIPIIFILHSCMDNSNNSKPSGCEYEVGDIVYLKPDSTKTVITGGYDCCSFYGRYTDKRGRVERINFGKEQIYEE